jgi:transcription termination factor Rho
VNINIEKLSQLSVYELRNLARSLGIARPTTIVRDKLIKEIMSTDISTAKTSTKRGRPARVKDFKIDNLLESKKINTGGIAELLDDWQEEKQEWDKQSVKANDADTGEITNIDGFVYILPRGHAVLISKSMNTYFISVKQVLAHNLKTGDYIETRTDAQTVIDILRQSPTSFNDAESVRPHKMQKIDTTDFKLGDRVILYGAKPFDFIEYIAEHNKKIKNAYKIALIIDQSDDCINFLSSSGIDEVYPASTNQNLKKKVLFALSSLLVAKRQASVGKNVILFIDNLNKLFKLYNASMFDSNVIDVTQFHVDCHVDLKTFFMQAKQSANSGSVTIITFLREPMNELEKYALDDFIDLCTVFEKII